MRPTRRRFTGLPHIGTAFARRASRQKEYTIRKPIPSGRHELVLPVRSLLGKNTFSTLCTPALLPFDGQAPIMSVWC